MSDLKYWSAIVGGALISVFLGEMQPKLSWRHHVMRGVFRFLLAIMVAWLGTDPLIHFLSLNREVYDAVIAGALAITSYRVVHFLMRVADDPLTWFRGAGK